MKNLEVNADTIRELKWQTFNAVHIFLNDDARTEWMRKAHLHNGFVFATDSYSAIKAPKEFCDFEVAQSEYVSDKIESLLKEPNTDHILKLNINEFEKYKVIDDYDTEEISVECSECEGSGEVEWEYSTHTMYTRMDVCPVCDGDGVVDDFTRKLNGDKVFGEFYIGCGNSFFTIKNFHKLALISEMTKEDVHIIYQGENNDVSVFKIGHLEVYIMPIHMESFDFKNVVMTFSW